MNKKLISKKLNSLTKPELAVLQRMSFAIETKFYNISGEKRTDFFKKDRFGKIDNFELYKMARMLNEEFRVVHIHEREINAFRVSFNDDRDFFDFIEFKKMVDTELGRDDGTSADQIYRPFAFREKKLIGGYSTNKLSIKKENSHEYILLEKAFELPVNSRIDKMTFEDTDDLSFQQIYDTARRLNNKNEYAGTIDYRAYTLAENVSISFSMKNQNDNQRKTCFGISNFIQRGI